MPRSAEDFQGDRQWLTPHLAFVAQAAEHRRVSADAVQHGDRGGGGEHADASTESARHAPKTGAHEATVFPPFDASTFPSQILWFALDLRGALLLMSRVALPQIGSIIDKRKARIEGDLKEAERLRGETDKAVAAYEQALSEARKNAHGIAEETRAGDQGRYRREAQSGRGRPRAGRSRMPRRASPRTRTPR